MNWVRIWQDVTDDGMASLVIRRQFLFLVAHDLRFALWTDRYSFKRFGQLFVGNLFLVAPCSDDGRLVGDVCQISTA